MQFLCRKKKKKYLIHSPYSQSGVMDAWLPNKSQQLQSLFSIVAGDAKPSAQLKLTIFFFNTRHSWQQPLYLSLTSPLNLYLICGSQWLLCFYFAWWAIKVIIFLLVSKKTFTNFPGII